MGAVPRAVVDELNTVQIHAADRYVYLHPRSGLEAFAQDAAQWRTGKDVTEDSSAGC